MSSISVPTKVMPSRPFLSKEDFRTLTAFYEHTLTDNSMPTSSTATLKRTTTPLRISFYYPQ
jgi:hypothetical protein